MKFNTAIAATAAAAFILAAPCPAGARGYVALGAYCGYVNDEGNLSVYPGMLWSPQKNIIAGAVMKFDLWPFIFFRIAGGRSAALSDASVLDNSHGGLEGWKISYFTVPWHLAMYFPFDERGSLYTGAGITYFRASGYIDSGGRKNFSEGLFGYGLLLGAQARIYGALDFFMEFEYVQARTSPLADTDSDGFRDYPADLSGPRINFGFLYYVAGDY